MSKRIVIVARHGEKGTGDKKDSLTAKGAMQIYGLAELLERRYGRIGKIAYSGANRTRQCSAIAAIAMGFWNPTISLNPLFHFEVPFETVFKSQMDPYLAECEAIKTAGGTMKEALEISEYTRVARKQIAQAIIEYAASADPAIDPVILAFSHGSYAEFAIPEHQLSDFPSLMQMGSAIAYEVENGIITNATFIIPAVA
ncbi:MAG: histidine phosphatase family protein [Patescibacteria group bacterium]|nr:histidine phosphatase family protein [Patescibacteria group bacterium]